MKKLLLIIILSNLFLTGCFKENIEQNNYINLDKINSNINNKITTNEIITNTGNIEKESKIKNATNTNISQNEEKKIANTDNYLINYTDSEFGFTISYPKEAYLQTKCGKNNVDELVPLRLYKENNKYKVGYSKKLEKCTLKDITEYIDSHGLDFEVYTSKTKEEFINEAFNHECLIRDVKIWKDTISRIYLDKNNSKPLTCDDFSSYIFYDEKTKKGVVFHGSSADYHIQKYTTYEETMGKGSYDKDIMTSLNFNGKKLDNLNTIKIPDYKYKTITKSGELTIRKMDNFFNLCEPQYNIPQPDNKYISNLWFNLGRSSISDITKLFDINNLEEILNSTQDNAAVCVIGKVKVETEGFKITKVLEKELYKDVKCYSEK